MTNIPTSQSATAKLITKQLVTVRSRRVVRTDKITNVFPITVITISTHKSRANIKSVQSMERSCESAAVAAAAAATVVAIVDDDSACSKNRLALMLRSLMSTGDAVELAAPKFGAVFVEANANDGVETINDELVLGGDFNSLSVIVTLFPLSRLPLSAAMIIIIVDTTKYITLATNVVDGLAVAIIIPVLVTVDLFLFSLQGCLATTTKTDTQSQL